jgi:hypothetical protein
MSNTGKSRVKLNNLAQPYEELTADETKKIKGGAEHDDDEDEPYLSGNNAADPDSPTTTGSAPSGTISTGKKRSGVFTTIKR